MNLREMRCDNVRSVLLKIHRWIGPDRQPWTNIYIIWTIYFHNGPMLGVPGQLVVMTEGIVLLILSITGSWIWVLRRRKAWACALGLTPSYNPIPTPPRRART